MGDKDKDSLVTPENGDDNFERPPERSFSMIEKRTIQRAIVQVEEQGETYKKAGLSPFTFFSGQVNLSLTWFILGKWPEVYWIFMTLKCWFYLGCTWKDKFTKDNGKELLFMTEVCWVACHFYMLFLTAALFAAMGVEGPLIEKLTNERYFFYVFWMFANGPFAFSVVLMKNALVLHDLPNIAVTFIHLTPCSLAWTLRWYSPRVLAQFPNVFDLPLPEDMSATFMDMFMPTFYFYITWWVLFVIYTFLYARYHGTPYSKYETCFMLYMNGFPPIAKAFGYDGSTAEKHARMGPFLIYQTILGFGALAVISFSFIFWKYFWAHTAFVVILFLFCTWNGAMRYFNMMTKYYVKSLKNLAAIEGSVQPDDETIPKEGGQKEDDYYKMN